ncbi:spermidine synthase [Streptococcus pneumoniae]|nr:spermidine synthase [Streptococcus pneumoniae]
MDLWFSEVHTPDVKLSLRTAKQLYAGKSEWQDIEVLDTPAFGKILILNGHVLFSDADDFVYNEMTVHVPMAVHPNPKKVLVRQKALEKVHFFKGNPVLISEITSLFVRQMAALF